MAGYGFTQPKYGTAQPRQLQSIASPLVKAMSGGTATSTDPFGLSSGLAGTAGFQKLNPFQTQNVPKTSVSQAPVSTSAQPFHETPQQPGNQQQAPTPATVYDVNTDPVLQQVNAYTNMSDAQIKAQADQQQRDQIIQSGLESLASSLGDASLAKAAAQNPTSSKAQLDKQKELSLHDLLNSLTTGGHNLGYSGYRTSQEGQVGNNYLQGLSDLTNNVRGNLGGINSAMLAALAGNQQQRIGALGDAYGREAAAPPILPGTQVPADLISGGSSLFGEPNDPLTAALIPGGVASRLKRFAA